MNTSWFLTLQGAVRAECLLGAAILSAPRYFLKVSLCPLNSMVELVCVVPPQAVSVSRRWWFCHSPGKDRLNVILGKLSKESSWLCSQDSS